MNFSSHAQTKESLSFSEWIVVFGIILLFLSLSPLIWHENSSSSNPNMDAAAAAAPYIEVWVEGAVVHPGCYQVAQGATLKTVLDQAVLCSDANLKGIRKGRKLKDGETIVISQNNLQNSVEGHKLDN